MAKILLIISALVIAATAYLGFATKQKVEILQGDLADKKKVLAVTQADLSKTKTTLKTTENELVAAKATIEEKEKDISAKKGQIDSLTTELTSIKADNEEKTKKLADIQAQIDALTTKGPGGGIDEMTTKIRELSEAKSALEVQLAESKQVQETLTRNLNAEKSKTVAAETQVTAYKTEYTKPGVTGTILAYNPGWNFVVLSIGDKQSLKAGKEMVVTRDGQMVGKVRVTSVEPSTSIADIIPSTVPKGQSVQPGDRVVYEGRK